MKGTFDLKRTALVVVDVQNDFCHREGGLGMNGADVSMVEEMIPTLEAFIDTCHSLNLPIIYIQTIHEPATDSETWKRRLEGKGPGKVCRKGTWGADFYKVSPTERDIVVIKHRYSAFIHTRLDMILRTMKVDTLLMAGVSTNVCVESTARDGFMLDYDILFLSDCTASYNRSEHEGTLANIDQYFGSVTDSKIITSDLLNKNV